MNPDGTNPATNTGAGAGSGAGSVVPPALDFTSSDTTSLSMADSLASAADNLTSAGMAAKEPDTGSIAMNEIGASDPSAQMERPDEPLVPAAPVPGSIGSVTSGPAVAASDDATSSNAAASTGFGGATGFGGSATGFGGSTSFGGVTQPASASTFGTAPAASGMAGGSSVTSNGAMTTGMAGTATTNAVGTTAGTPSPVSATAAGTGATPAASEPYNPFAARTDAASAPLGGSSAAGTTAAMAGAAGATAAGMKSTSASGTSSMNVPAGLQPATEKFSAKLGGAKKPSMLTVILGILAVVALVMAIVFAVLWQQALANQEVTYVPPTDDGGNVNQTVAMITCTKDLGADVVTEMPGLTGHTVAATASFAGDQLGSISVLNRYSFVDNAAAEAARPRFDEAMVWYGDIAASLGIAAVESALEIADVTANFSVTAAPTQLVGDYLNVLGLTAGADGTVDSSRAGIQANYEANGYVCAED